MVRRAAWATAGRVLRHRAATRVTPARRAAEAIAKGIRDGRMVEARAGPTAARMEVHTVVVVAIQRHRTVMAVRVVVITAARVVVTTAVPAAVTAEAPVVATAQVLMVEEDIAKPG